MIHYVEEHQINWDMFVTPLTYANDTRVRWNTNTSPYSLLLSRQRPGTSLITASMNVADDSADATSRKNTITYCSLEIKSDTHARKSQKEHKRNYDRRIRETHLFEPNDFLFINNLRLRSTSDSNIVALSHKLCTRPKQFFLRKLLLH